MNQQELVTRLKGILCWVQQDSTAAAKLKELIIQLGGRV
jgi:hypothetical protein